MKIKITGILLLLVLASFGLVLSGDEAPPQAASAPAPGLQENNDSNTQWVWGEVVIVDSQAKTLTLKYLDYETDQEKELLLATDDSTSYQNFRSLEDIQVKDNLSVDYISKDGKNIAKSVSLEKTEAAPQTALVPPTDKSDTPETIAATTEPAGTDKPAEPAQTNQ